MKNKKFLIIVCLILIIILSSCILFLVNRNSYNNNENPLVNTTLEGDVKIKKNVVVNTARTNEMKRPFAVNTNSLSFKKDPGFKENTIIVSDITEEAPYGYLRKVIRTEKVEDYFVIYTENAQLTDVFEELHLSTTIQLTDEKNSNLEISNTKADLLSISPKVLLSATSKSASRNIKDTSENIFKLFEIEFDETFDLQGEENVSLAGDVEGSALMEMQIDISDSKLNLFGMTLKDEINGNIIIGLGESAGLKFEKEFFNISPKLSIQAGPIPIVITNDISGKFDCEANIMGGIGLNIKIDNTSRNGFIYTSNNKKVKEINENNVLGKDVIKCSTGLMAKGSTSAGVSISVTTKFYDSTGPKISAGIKGETEGELYLDTKTINTEEIYYGELSLSIFPYISGELVINIPLIDKDLFDFKLFELEFKPLWEKEWSNVHPLKQKNAYELLGVTYKEIVDCFGSDYTWYDGNGAMVLYYPDEISKYGFCFGNTFGQVYANETSPVTSVHVEMGGEIYEDVCVGDDISKLEKLSGEKAHIYIDEMDFPARESFSINIEDFTIWGYRDGTKITSATISQ